MEKPDASRLHSGAPGTGSAAAALFAKASSAARKHEHGQHGCRPLPGFSLVLTAKPDGGDRYFSSPSASEREDRRVGASTPGGIRDRQYLNFPFLQGVVGIGNDFERSGD